MWYGTTDSIFQQEGFSSAKGLIFAGSRIILNAYVFLASGFIPEVFF